ncbi:LysR family transcriptional regulator [Acidisphaera sp. L21]|jgi:DNA-binding transcriptional LysR family regulator|uniref:LysR family transcriptional regulator n=1 Tax=Acidisphaera sp. L21 TaxID=1641851 RepID=UPI00131DA69C|nr:LysR substrate-binding domain-containing protein [Acidisphaera sp. L21]
MSTTPTIDTALLRVFAYIAEDGSFTRAAERVGRTQSAVSMQVQRLEQMLGETLLLRGKGGQVHLTSHGRYLLERSRDLLAINDQIWDAFHAPTVQGTVRLGTPDDYALRYLPAVLRRFALSHPAVDVEVMCAPSYQVVQHVQDGDLDLALCSDGHTPKGLESVLLWEGPLRWITSAKHAPHRMDPLPLALALETHGCTWRRSVLGALEKDKRRYRVAYTSASLTGTHTPVMAGLAVTVSNVTWVPEGLRLLPPGELPALPNSAIQLLKARKPAQPVTDVLAAHIAATFEEEMRRSEAA